MALDTESFDLLLASVQRFILERLVPAEDVVEATDDVPADIIEDMKEMGLFGMSIPEEYGGIGLSMSQECRVIYEFGHTSVAFRSVFGSSVGIGSQGILMDGTSEQKAAWLPRVASGEMIMSFALTEPGSGSDSASITTRAEIDGDDGRAFGGDKTSRLSHDDQDSGLPDIGRSTGHVGAGENHQVAFLAVQVSVVGNEGFGCR